jgi:hypothetical protein
MQRKYVLCILPFHCTIIQTRLELCVAVDKRNIPTSDIHY